MRLLHFADLHLGVETYGHPDPDTGLNSRFLDFLKALDSVVDFALHGDIDLVLFCGDAYRRGHSVDPTEQREFARRMATIASHGIPVFLVVGNHDIPKARGKASTVDIFPTLSIPHIYVAARPAIYRIPTRRGELSIVALPYLGRGALLGREADASAPMEQVDRQFRERVRNIVDDLAAQAAPSAGSGRLVGPPAILAAHLAVMEGRLGSEREFVLGTDPALPVTDLARPPFNYVALGHFHQAQVLSQDPPAVYAGSLERLDFSDEGVEKGFCEVELAEAGPARFTFHPLPARAFVTLDIDLAGQAAPMEALCRELEARREKLKGAIVRTRLLGVGRGLVPEREVVRLLREEFGASYALPPTVSTARRPTRLGQADLSAPGGLTPLAALQLYLEQKRTDPAQLSTLLEYGRRLVEEEEAGPGG